MPVLIITAGGKPPTDHIFSHVELDGAEVIGLFQDLSRYKQGKGSRPLLNNPLESTLLV